MIDKLGYYDNDPNNDKKKKRYFVKGER